MVCEGKSFAHHLMRICVYVYKPKKSQPNHLSIANLKILTSHLKGFVICHCSENIY